MKKKVEGLSTIIYYDGPVEFVGATLSADGYRKTVLGFYLEDGEDGDRMYDVWERTDDAMSMQFLGHYSYNEIDWTNLDR